LLRGTTLIRFPGESFITLNAGSRHDLVRMEGYRS